MRVCITGASGFIGQYLSPYLQTKHHQVIAASRSAKPLICDQQVQVPKKNVPWDSILKHVEGVVHLANRAHIMRASDADAYYRINVDGTRAVAEAAVRQGVKRFIYLSSLKVNGEVSHAGPIDAHSPVAPMDDYSLSKWEAEKILWQIAHQSSLEVVIIRPPLVYGPKVKGNIQTLLHWIAHNRPLLLQKKLTQRSMVSVQNLSDLIATCLVHPDAPGHTFFVEDNHASDVRAFIDNIAAMMNVNPTCLILPAWLLKAIGKSLGISKQIQRLTHPLVVDARGTEAVLNWHPPVPYQEALAQMVAWYTEKRGH